MIFDSEVLLFTKINYKVAGDSSLTTAYMFLLTVGLPNFIARFTIPVGAETFVRSAPTLIVRGAGGNELGMFGQVSITIRFKSTAIDVPF